jgi:hypothetical protein
MGEFDEVGKMLSDILEKEENKKWIILASLITMPGVENVENINLNNVDVLIAVGWLDYGPNHVGVIRNER